jgi:diamine N-acetyltransferase
MIRLNSMGPEHIDATYAWLATSPHLRRQIDSLGIPTPERNRAYWERNFADQSREDYAIVEQTDGHIGNCGLMGIDRERRKAELWIYLAEAKGRGYGSAALNLLLRRAFVELELNRVHLRVVSSNERAVAFYQRAGFSLEGCARADTIHDGTPTDSILLALLRDEYRKTVGK